MILKGTAYLPVLEQVTRTMRRSTAVVIINNKLFIDGHPICDLKGSKVLLF